MTTTTVRAAATTRADGYLPYLDGLRALAVAGVIVGHAGAPTFGGYHGVTLFFVISGFLITGLLRRERNRTGRIDLRGFYRRRFARLAPAFLVALAATSAWLLATGTSLAVFWRELVYAATYTSDIALPLDPQADTTGLFEWSWSLAIEEQFYLVWPLVLLAVASRRLPDRWLLALCGAGIALVWVDRAVLALASASHARQFYAFDVHADALLAGAALSVLVARPALQRRGLALALTAAGALGLALVFLRPGVLFLVPVDAGGFGPATLLAVALLAGLALAPTQPAARLLGHPVLAHLGKLSYGLYLWNFLTIAVFTTITGVAPLRSWWGWAWLAALLVVVEVSYRYVERPARAWLSKPRRHRSAALVEPEQPAPGQSAIHQPGR